MLVGALLWPAQAAVASCARDPGPAGSPVIFVGTALGERRGYTRFHVDEVWAGPDLAPEVWVLSGQQQLPWPLSLLAEVGSSVDADLVRGERYVVGASRSFVTSECLVSEAGVSGDGTPADAREPVDGGVDGADPPIGPVAEALWVAGVLAGLSGMAGLWRRRRPVTRSPQP